MELKAQKKVQEKERKLRQKEQKQSNMAARMAAMTPEEKAEKKALTSARLDERRQQDQLKKQRLKQVESARVAVVPPADAAFLLGKLRMQLNESDTRYEKDVDASYTRSHSMTADQSWLQMKHTCVHLPHEEVRQ